MSLTSSVSLLLGFFTFLYNFILAQMYGLYKGPSTNNFQITPPLFLMDNIKLEGIPTKIKKYILFLHCISSFEGISLKNVKDATTSSFISCFLLSFTSADTIFHKFSEFYSTLFEKTFLPQTFLIDSTPPPIFPYFTCKLLLLPLHNLL